jgi:HPt (histidine-containing phosphotransfer) domain-containing protein
VLLALTDQLGDPDGALVDEIVSLYLAQGRELVDRLQIAAEVSDTVTLREVAHSLKGSTLAVGGARLATLCQRIERAESSTDGRDAARAVPEEFEQLAHQLSEPSRRTAQTRRENRFPD